MLEELRLSPRSQAARFAVCCPGLSATAHDREAEPSLSTAFAERARLRSTTPSGPIHSVKTGAEVTG